MRDTLIIMTNVWVARKIRKTIILYQLSLGSSLSTTLTAPNCDTPIGVLNVSYCHCGGEGRGEAKAPMTAPSYFFAKCRITVTSSVVIGKELLLMRNSQNYEFFQTVEAKGSNQPENLYDFFTWGFVPSFVRIFNFAHGG